MNFKIAQGSLVQVVLIFSSLFDCFQTQTWLSGLQYCETVERDKLYLFNTVELEIPLFKHRMNRTFSESDKILRLTPDILYIFKRTDTK